MDVRSGINNFVNQVKLGADAAKSLSYSKSTDSVLIAGMGGSAMPGRIMQMFVPSLILHEDYDLPVSIPTGTLVICISWSGNTEETISAYQAAREKGLETIIITNGGQLEKLAQEDNTPVVVLPSSGEQPRMATGYMLGALLQILGFGDQLNIELTAELETQGQTIAKQIAGKTPLIYSTAKYQALSYYWKILFNESSKIHAFTNYFPRIDHNELAGFNSKDKDKFFYIAFRDDQEDNKQNHNLDSAIAIIAKMGYTGLNVNLSGTTLLDKVFNSCLLGLWTSYYLAQELGVDPSDIKVIEDFKKLKNN